ncbi:PIN domain-like protein [Pseudovirgaria hyperparasitica]|uniref:PIN domain-like protein n=1 Tax=Pseudovirgaria hyperparasitica TaxID=470096 RepID=A0A6A6W014_9PEZI|nr:PIN domain-like protein [Pseudovirgaria hyperparasitica]KAF2755270.1 PIN domain-like protein [Pseudovirgaria hyperparasitica]
MGVTGLWEVVKECGRPIKIETLNRKRLAVDASIWIYQFLKAVRDKEGNALRNSHVVGFFRRICKLLFIGIKPVFVFDGGAPILKRQTISSRRSRREGRRDDAVRTAGKLLAVQMQKRAEEEEQKRKDVLEGSRHNEEEEELPDNLVYVDQIGMTAQERQQSKKFRKTDAYHLPDLDASMASMGAPNDPRIMSLEELEQYARQFEQGEDISVYDFSKIDYDSAFFTSLPEADRYNILNAARLRSRLRMGYSREQLDVMFPDRMAFSKFQIDRVKERNELTQRLMNINGMNEQGMLGVNGTSRVAGERGREYVLIKNDGVEGGWALGVVSSKDDGQRNKPIDIDELDKKEAEEEEEDWEDDEDFEDVPIEGLNRLPKQRPSDITLSHQAPSRADGLAKRRAALYSSRRQSNSRRVSRMNRSHPADPESLFIAEDAGEEDLEVMKADHSDDAAEEYDTHAYNEDEELERAIAMSMQQGDDIPGPLANNMDMDVDNDYEEVFRQSRVDEAKPFTRGSGMSIAHMANARSNKAAVAPDVVSEDEDHIDFQAALAESRRSKRTSSPTRQKGESKKKMQDLEEDRAGGFEKKDAGPKTKKGEPLPPWFAGKLDDDLAASKAREDEERDKESKELSSNFQFQEIPTLRKEHPGDVIDLEAPEASARQAIFIDSSDDDEPEGPSMKESVTEESEIKMGDLADKVRVEPPTMLTADVRPDPASTTTLNLLVEEAEEEPLDWEASDNEISTSKGHITPADDPGEVTTIPYTRSPIISFEDRIPDDVEAVNNQVQLEDAKSLSPDFEDVPMKGSGNFPLTNVAPILVEGDVAAESGSMPAAENTNHQLFEEIDEEEEDGALYSDPEDEALFLQLAAETEEHARFVSTFNNKTQEQNARDYDQELRQLRNQQKKDRRDADEVTQTMITECQQLLALFGLPYITAPMEAEAQCAELVQLQLVDGIVTDDSDCFLFGGNRIYKNMFNQAKHVQCYLTPDITDELGLDRKKLIAIAQLLGSDYTEGLPGVGPVSALEILSEFGDLESFKRWWNSVQDGSLPISAETSAFRKKFRRAQGKKLFLPLSFPDPRVEEAYLKPEVDKDPSQFQWGVPNLEALRDFLMATIGWTRERTDEVLVPVIKDMNQRETEGTQANITSFFEGGVGAGSFAPRVREGGTSARMANALSRIRNQAKDGTAGNTRLDVAEEAGEAKQTKDRKTATKRKARTSDSKAKETRTSESASEGNGEMQPKKKPKRRSKAPG